MKIPILIGAIATVLLIAALVLIGGKSAPNTATHNVANASHKSPSKIVATKTSHDFGTISMAKGKVTYDFEVRNASNEPIELHTLSTSCMCTETTLHHNGKRFGPFGMAGHGGNISLKDTIAPGETATIQAIFDPAAHGPAGVGPIQRDVILEDNTGTLTLAFKAMVTP